MIVIGSAPVGAVTLRLCTDEHSHLPFITPTGDGISDILIREAANEAGVSVEFHSAPPTRCREEIRANLADGFPTSPYTSSLLTFMAFPMKDGEADSSRAVTSTRALVFRRIGSTANWDGAHFTQLSTAVLVPLGAALLLDRAKAIGVPIDNTGNTLDVNFAKMLAGRADLALGSEYSGQVLMTRPEFVGKIEVLPIPFSDESYFLGLSKRFRDTNPDAAEQIWDAIGRIRRTNAYQDQLRKALEEAARMHKE
jgi:polar amino acid transport system substrate-binding protein